jgi:two-component system, NtrC family, nitrogen regulation response regulator NtrX
MTHHPPSVAALAGSAGQPAIFAASSAMQAVLEAVRAAAATHGGVLVCGESGSGRQMIARELHRLSTGSGAAFVCVDCAEVEELESVLFGIPPPPSNGDLARSKLDRISRISLLHLAVGGTLFLAHLPEMPARVQARLVRVLRDGEVSVMESRRTVPTRMRLIASADPGWDTAVAEGQIRSDLCKRCSATRIDIPPLRERREDIPALAAMLLQEICSERGLETRSIDPSAMSLLCAFPWRGNTRELRALLHTLVQRSDGSTLRLEEVLSSVHLDGSAKSFLGAGTLREAKERFERDYIVAVLERHRGRVGEAARALGIQRPNLYRKMRSLRLPPPRAGASQA